MRGPFVGCAICGHEETHDPICELHECADCGAHGKHHCPAWCDVPGCAICFADDAYDCNVRRIEAPKPVPDRNSPEALKIEQRLVDEDRCGWKRPRR